jgi:hypothetical protein
MILILSQTNDETARRFKEDALGSGVDCLIVNDWNDVKLGITVERDRAVRLELTAGESGRHVTGILNRGVPPAGSSPEEVFQAAESLASWWSLLFSFPGPVVNRSSRMGFLPNVDNLSLARAVPGLRLPSAVVSTQNYNSYAESVITESVINVHRVRDGQYLGRLGARSTVLDRAEVHLFTPFDPNKIAHILVAGNHVFDLSNYSGSVDSHLMYHMKPLIKELHRRHATFALLILENAPAGFRLLHATAFPGYGQYHYFSARVHAALLEYLTA